MKALLFLVLLTGCGGVNQGNGKNRVLFEGFAMKGPFVRGSEVVLWELNDQLSSSGKSFSNTISSSLGEYSFGELELDSSVVEVSVDGYYFNEVTSAKSAAPLNIKSLVDVHSKSGNVNLLTHIASRRIRTLIDSGLSFERAKPQAESECLQAFGFGEGVSTGFEERVVHQENDANAQLLASSLILQGYRQEGELTELLFDIGEDLAEDGTFDEQKLLAALMNHVPYLRPEPIKDGLIKEVKSIDSTAVIPDFVPYIQRFSDKYGSFQSAFIEYPTFSFVYGANQVNLLNPETTALNGDMVLAAKVPKGARIVVNLREESGKAFQLSLIVGSESSDWSVKTDQTKKLRTFESKVDDRLANSSLFQLDKGDYILTISELGLTDRVVTRKISSSGP